MSDFVINSGNIPESGRVRSLDDLAGVRRLYEAYPCFDIGPESDCMTCDGTGLWCLRCLGLDLVAELEASHPDSVSASGLSR